MKNLRCVIAAIVWTIEDNPQNATPERVSTLLKTALYATSRPIQELKNCSDREIYELSQEFDFNAYQELKDRGLAPEGCCQVDTLHLIELRECPSSLN